MELVHGAPITDYCRERDLPVRERLALFIKVCQAIQHAHQKGIIHRDLKPSNILVTEQGGEPTPRIIDFGVAKALQQAALSDGTLFTRFEQAIGTPVYMAPEQAEMSGLEADTRSDIYSLGALLYELLSDRPPHDPDSLRGAGLEEMRRFLCEHEPKKPSTCVATLEADARTAVARNRGASSSRLVGQLRGDLDCIVLKALEHDRSRRYAGAGEFARDLQRHLDGEAILARPPGILYRLQRSGRRNKAAIGAAAVIFLCLSGGAVFSLAQWRRAEGEAARAQSTLDELRAIPPALTFEARALAAQGKLEQAFEKLDKAIEMAPGSAETHLAKAILLRANFRFAEAVVGYQQALAIDPNLARADHNTALCNRLAQEMASRGQLSLDSIRELYQQAHAEECDPTEMGMIKEQFDHHVDEIVPRVVTEMAGGETGKASDFEVGTWQVNFNDLPERSDLSPLRGLPIRSLVVGQWNVTDLSALRGMPLESLLLGTREPIDLAVLHHLPLKRLWIAKLPPGAEHFPHSWRSSPSRTCASRWNRRTPRLSPNFRISNGCPTTGTSIPRGTAARLRRTS